MRLEMWDVYWIYVLQDTNHWRTRVGRVMNHWRTVVETRMNLSLPRGKKYPNQLCSLCGPPSGVTEDSSLLECDAVSCGS